MSINFFFYTLAFPFELKQIAFNFEVLVFSRIHRAPPIQNQIKSWANLTLIVQGFALFRHQVFRGADQID